MGAMKKAKDEGTKVNETPESTDKKKKTQEKKPAEPRVYSGADVRIEPNPASKRGKVYAAGKTKEGGSRKQIAEEFGCTASNVSQHLAQINKICGFELKVDGDRFWFSGDPTVTWKEQKAEKEKKKAEKEKAKKKTSKKKKAEKKTEDPSESPVEPPVKTEVTADTDDFI